jgi:hypothetical protein
MVQQPRIISGGVSNDARGSVFYNNAFDLSLVKRVYAIENAATVRTRGWQGHRIEQRWFMATKGSFEITVVPIDTWPAPKQPKAPIVFTLTSGTMNVLHVPAGYMTSLKQKEESARLLIFSDYAVGEIQDEYRLPLDYFKL